jgi:Tripartite tricarboxylate transporter TctB family
VLLFGALGLFMVKFDWPRPPLLLGLVLGGIAETNLFIATRIYGASWLTHPGVLVIALLILLGLLYPVYENWRKSRRHTEARSPIQSEPARLVEAISVRSRIAHALFALFFVGLFTFIVYQAKFGFGSWEPRAALFPLAIGIPCLILAILTVGLELFRSTRPMASENVLPAEGTREIAPDEARNRTMVIAGWIVGFFLAIWFLGFPIASAIATLLYLKFGGGERWATSLALALVAWAFFYGMFDYALKLPFPEGALMDWLKI